MSGKSESFLYRAIHDESGQTLVWASLLLVLILGVGGLVVDVGHAYICYHELQASTDAAALAAASQLPITTDNESSNTVSATGKQFSSQSGKYNAYSNLNTPVAITGAAATVTPGCVTDINLRPCSSTLLANAVQVTQTVTIPTMFIRALGLFGIKSAQSLTLSATATAQMRGAQRGPYNVAIVMDATGSMSYPDGGGNCNGSKARCAEEGAQILLSEFSPCLPGQTNCGTATNGNVSNAVDEVSLFTFPASSPGTQISYDETCNATQTSTNPWPYPLIAYPDSTTYGTIAHSSSPSMPTISRTNLNTLVSEYQVVPLSSNYRSSDSTATGTNPLTSSTTVDANNPSIVNAIGGNTYFGGSGCTGTYVCAQYTTRGNPGCVSTFFAGALFTAQEYLANNARSNATNVIILLSDGDANGGTMSSSNLTGNGGYPDSSDECQQAIDVAGAAKAAGTKIYTVGYGVASGGCATDGTYNRRGQFQQDGLTACQTLQKIASSPTNFFVDTSSVSCSGATSVTMNGKTNTLSAIFTAIAGDLSLPRLLPNDNSETGFTPSAL
jgi:Flp pilus assembly protein TadG